MSIGRKLRSVSVIVRLGAYDIRKIFCSNLLFGGWYENMLSKADILGW